MENDELTEQELAEFLHEIADEDDEINEQEAEIEAEVTKLDSSIGNLYEGTRFETSFKPTAEARQKYVISEARIKREAFNQSLIDLSALIPKEHFRALIAMLTAQHTRIIAKYLEYINNRIGKLLLKYMPGTVKNCWRQYPHVMRKSPGFLYKVPPKHGKDYIFWAYPNIPAFYPQHQEREIIQAKSPKAIQTLDRAIIKYYTHIRNKQKREIRFAEIFIRNNIKTYFDLLKFKPVMWEMLYNYIKSQNE